MGFIEAAFLEVPVLFLETVKEILADAFMIQTGFSVTNGKHRNSQS